MTGYYQPPVFHVCDDRCGKCPVCGAPCYYADHARQHACSVASCAWLEKRVTVNEAMQQTTKKRRARA
jgi:hypothetical protein